MNSYIKNIKEDFIKTQELTCRRIYLSDTENKEVLKKYKQNPDEIRQLYKVAEDTVGNLHLYTEISEEITDKELSEYIFLKSIQKLDSIDDKLSIIKSIMAFWCVLTVLGIIGTIIILGQLM